MSLGDTRVRLNLRRAPKPLPSSHNIIVDVCTSDTTDKILNSLSMRVAVLGVESTTLIHNTGQRVPVASGALWGDYGLKPGLEYTLEVCGQAMDFDVGSEDTQPTEFITPEEYDKMPGTLRDHLRKNKLGKFSDDYQEKKLKQEQEQEELFQQLKDKVGSRVETDAGHRGELKYVNTTDFAPGYWAGVALDEPFGKNEGSVEGKSYFTCLNKCGIFLRLQKIKVGDFPPLDDGLDDDEII